MTQKQYQLQFKFSDKPLKHEGTQTIVRYVPLGIKTRKEFFEIMANTLDFPGYFGRNWDAFRDLILHSELYQGKKVILVHGDIPLKNNPLDLKNYLEILNEAIARNSISIKEQTESQKGIWYEIIFPCGTEVIIENALESE